MRICAPVEQTLQAQRAGGGLLQVLAQLQVVTQPPLAVQQAEQPRGLFGAQFADECRTGPLRCQRGASAAASPCGLRCASIPRPGGDGGGASWPNSTVDNAERSRPLSEGRTRPTVGRAVAGLGGLEQALPARSDGRQARRAPGHMRASLWLRTSTSLRAHPDQGAIPAGRGEDARTSATQWRLSREASASRGPTLRSSRSVSAGAGVPSRR